MRKSYGDFIDELNKQARDRYMITQEEYFELIRNGLDVDVKPVHGISEFHATMIIGYEIQNEK